MSSAEIALPQIKLRAGRARITICNLFVVPARMCCVMNFYFTRVYMYRIFSVVVSVAVMLPKNGSVTHLLLFIQDESMVWSGLESFAVKKSIRVSIGEIIVFTRYKRGLRQTNRTSTIGPLMFGLKRFDWISFILPQSRVTFYYYGVPCLSLSTSNHISLPLISSGSV